MTTDELAEAKAKIECGYSWHGDAEYNACECHDLGLELVTEVERLSSQLRIAEDVLTTISHCGCSACGPAPRDLAHARTLAVDALTRMWVAD